MRGWYRLALGGIGFLLAYAAVMAIFQEEFLFPRWQVLHTPAPPAASGFSEHALSCDAHKTSLRAWFHPGAADKPVAVYFPGNGMSLGQSAAAVSLYTGLGYGALLLSYPGYEGNEGAPGRGSILASVACALDWLRAEQPDAPVIYHGFSLGTGVAATIAEKQPPAALILEAPYTSLSEAASALTLLPAFLVRPLLRNDFRTTDICTAQRPSFPILIMHGTKDTIVPYRLGKKLSGICGDAATFLTIDGADHLDLAAHNTDSRIKDWLAVRLPLVDSRVLSH